MSAGASSTCSRTSGVRIAAPAIRSLATSIAASSITAPPRCPGRAHRTPGPPPARSQLHLRAESALPGGIDRTLGRGKVLDGEAERPEQRQLAVVAPPRGGPGKHLAEFRADVLLAGDQPLLDRQPELAGLVPQRLAAVAEQRARGHSRRVQLARPRA